MELSNTMYALDSTTIDLCLSVFPLASCQAASADQAVLWHIGKFSEDANLDRGIGLSVGRHCSKKLNLNVFPYTLLPVLSLTLFEKMPLQQAFQG